MLITILIVVLILMLIGALPNLGFSQSYGPSGVLGLILVILLILFLLGKI
jgi:hypothetical protein